MGTSILRCQTDERLVELARCGSATALEAALDRHRAALTRYCERLVGRARAEDVVQETLTRALRAIEDDERELQLRPWLFRVAHNLSLNVLRDTVGSEPLNDTGVTYLEPASIFEQAEDLRALVKSIRHLPERQRLALMLRALEGRSFDEIANIIGVSEPGVHQLLHRARTRLRKGAALLLPLPLLRLLFGGQAKASVGLGATGLAANRLARTAVLLLVAGTVAGGGVLLEHGPDGHDKPVLGSTSQGQSGADDPLVADQAATTPRSHLRSRNSVGAQPAPDPQHNGTSPRLQTPKRAERPGDDAPQPTSGGHTPSSSGSQPEQTQATSASWIWDAPTRIGAASEYGTGPTIATNSSGESIVAYATVGASTRIRAASAPAAGSFGSPVTVSAAGARWQQVGMGDNGEAVVIWLRDTTVEAAVRGVDGQFGAPQAISGPGGAVSGLDLAVAVNGDAAAVWLRDEGGGTAAVEAAVRRSGGGFGPSEVLARTSNGSFAPSVAMAVNGDAVVSWMGNSGLEIAAAVTGSGFSAPRPVAGSSASQARIAIDSAGNLVAAWLEPSGGGVAVRTRRGSVAGGLGSATTIDRSAGIGGLQLRLDAAGNAVAAWQASEGIFAAFGPSGSKLGAIQQVAAPGPVTPPQLTLDSQGNAILVWTRLDPNTWIVKAAYRPAGQAFTAVQSVSEPGGYALMSAGAVSASGRAFVVWTDLLAPNAIRASSLRRRS